LIDRQEKRQQETLAKMQREDDMLAAVQQHRNRPLYDEDQMLAYMEQNKLGPEHASVAYTAMSGYRRGVSVGEADAAARKAPPVMGSGGPPGVNPEFTSPADIQGPPDVGKQSWQDTEMAAAEDDSIK
jgi:hypothetical protein